MTTPPNPALPTPSPTAPAPASPRGEAATSGSASPGEATSCVGSGDESDSGPANSGAGAVCGTAGAAGCGGPSGAGCGHAALRRTSGPRPTVTVAEEQTIPATREVGWLLADSVWWGGRLRSGVALRIAPTGLIKPVPAEIAPAGTRRLPGTLLPGLVDAHVHSGLADMGTVRAGGIAGVWDLGGVPAKVAALAARARQPGTELPHIRYAGPFLIAPGGYPSDRSWAAAGSWWEINSVADARPAVQQAVRAGAGLIKVTAHTGGPTLPAPVLEALVTAAHDAGVPVVVHAEGEGTVAAAHSAGADMLAHTPWTEPLGDELLRACAERMTWISTLDIHGWGDPDPAREIAVGNLRRFLGYGGAVRYGTDLGNGPLPAGVNTREIRLLSAAGLTPDGILTAMTESDSTTVSWVAGGLDLEPAAFADSLATARVLDVGARPH